MNKVDAKTNIEWVAPSPAGLLDITINVVKPEKDPKAIEAARLAGSEACVLCWDKASVDYTVCLQDEEWGWWFSPYGYFPEHLIVSAPRHVPMNITPATFARLLDFVDAYPNYFVGTNADLPIVGGSLLSHDHYQGGRYCFPLMKASVREAFELPEFPQVEAGVVAWPSSVVRLRSKDRTALQAAAARIFEVWQRFDFEPCGIRAFTEEVPHNTVNAIVWREEGEVSPSFSLGGAGVGEGSGEGVAPDARSGSRPSFAFGGDTYVMDLVLRNNRTTESRPYGLFHPDESLFHIKKENIGLIEIMGRAILPGRLAQEMPGIQREINQVFYQVLQATGVFKDDTQGRAGWQAFLKAVTN